MKLTQYFKDADVRIQEKCIAEIGHGHSVIQPLFCILKTETQSLQQWDLGGCNSPSY